MLWFGWAQNAMVFNSGRQFQKSSRQPKSLVPEANRGDSARGHADRRLEGERESMRDDLDDYMYLVIVDTSQNRICFLSSLTLFTLTACTPSMA
jgi:hypothetical protein